MGDLRILPSGDPGLPRPRTVFLLGANKAMCAFEYGLHGVGGGERQSLKPVGDQMELNILKAMEIGHTRVPVFLLCRQA